MRKYFVTGLAILLPLAMTVAIVAFMVHILTAPFIGFVKPALQHFDLFRHGLLLLTTEQVVQYVSQAIILILLFLVTVLLGWLTRWFFIHTFLRISDYVLHRIPLINTIYKTSKDVIKTIFGSDSRSFKQVALVPFPGPHVRSIGLITREDVPGDHEGELTAVFVPTTPNPTSGFMMLFDRKDITYLDMSIENAFKYIISCGVIASPFKAVEQTANATMKPKEGAEKSQAPARHKAKPEE